MSLVIDGRELAALLKTHPASIRAYRAGQRATPVLRGLPEPIQTQPKLLWWRADIEAWIESRRTFKPASTPPEPPAPQLARRGPGRPRKTAAAEKGGAA